MSLRGALLGVLICGILTVPRVANALDSDCHYVESVSFGQGVAVVEQQLICPSGQQPGSEITAAMASTSEFYAGIAACLAEVIELFGATSPFCTPFPVDATPVLTPGLVAAALRRVDLPASELVVQPPNGRTLVNFATNFYTEARPFTRTITLLGQRVDLRITPASYGWRFGDGASVSTSTPGAAYPDLQVTHDYLSAGTVSPAVDTTYTADFRVNGGGWRPVPGTVTIPGASVPLEVVEATPTLVGYR